MKSATSAMLSMVPQLAPCSLPRAIGNGVRVAIAMIARLTATMPRPHFCCRVNATLRSLSLCEVDRPTHDGAPGTHWRVAR